MDKPERSLCKSVSWRLFSFCLTVIIIFAYTKNISQALGVGAGIDLVKMVLYYIHERLWNRVDFGRHEPPDYQI